MQQTENELDLAIEGDGFFQIVQPNGEIAYSRDGAFKLDSQGRIVNSDGFQLEPAITIPSDAVSVSMGIDGTVSVLQAGSETPSEIGTIELVRFLNPAGLNSIGRNLYLPTAASGNAIAGTAGEDGLGTISQGYLEMSNVSVVDEMVNMITAQRAYEVNSKPSAPQMTCCRWPTRSNGNMKMRRAYRVAWTGRRLIMAVMVLLAVPCALAAALPVEIALDPSARIESDRITLGQIARIHANDPARGRELGALAIARAPLPGQDRRLDRRDLTLRLRQAGVDPSQIRFSGAEAVIVSRTAVTLSQAQMARIASDWVLAHQPFDPGQVRIASVQTSTDVVLPAGRLTYRVEPPRKSIFCAPCPDP